MELNQYLAGRLKEVLTEGRWVVGTNFMTELTDLSWKDANTQIDNYNTIAAITFHINYYLDGVNNVFEGGSLEIKDQFSFDAPPLESSKDWKSLVNRFSKHADRFIHHVENMSEEALLKPFADQDYGSTLRNIDVMIEHAYYHLGQIILIKKKLKNQYTKPN